MECTLTYSRSSSDACVVFSQIETPQEELNINKDSSNISSLPLLSIRLHIDTHELHWYKPPNKPKQYQYDRHIHVNSLHLEYYPSIYTCHTTCCTNLCEIIWRI